MTRQQDRYINKYNFIYCTFLYINDNASSTHLPLHFNSIFAVNVYTKYFRTGNVDQLPFQKLYSYI